MYISKPWFASDFMVRLLEYNPHMYKSTDDLKPSPRNFIYLLSQDEMNQVKDATRKSLKLVKDSCEWLEKNSAKYVRFYCDHHFQHSQVCSDVMGGLYSEEFQEAHPPPTDLQRLQNLLYYYLKYISGICKTVNTVLS